MSMGLYSLINYPSRITNNSNSILDNFYINVNTDSLI